MKTVGTRISHKHPFQQNAQEGPACQDRRGSRKQADTAPTSVALLAMRETSPKSQARSLNIFPSVFSVSSVVNP